MYLYIMFILILSLAGMAGWWGSAWHWHWYWFWYYVLIATWVDSRSLSRPGSQKLTRPRIWPQTSCCQCKLGSVKGKIFTRIRIMKMMIGITVAMIKKMTMKGWGWWWWNVWYEQTWGNRLWKELPKMTMLKKQEAGREWRNTWQWPGPYNIS